MNKKIVGIDFGLKRMGLAISDQNQCFALPWTTITGGEKELFSTLDKRKTEIEAIVIGLPLLLNGSKGEMALIVERFGKKLEETLSIPVFFLDERLSSKQADVSLKDANQNRKSRVMKTDQIAATIILETFLMQKRNRSSALL